MPTVLLQVDAKDSSSAVLKRVQQALAGIDRALQSVNAAAGSSTLDSQIGAYSKLASAADGTAGALARMTRGYRDVAAAADAAARAAAKVKPPSGGGGSGGGGGGGTPSSGGGGTEGRRSLLSGSGALLAGTGYYAAYLLGSQLSNSVGRSADFSRITGSTRAETGLTAAQTDTLSAQITGMSGGGKLPFDRSTLMSGAYSLASLGIGSHTSDFGGSVAAITGISARMSAAANATDTASASDAIVSVLNDFGLNNQNVVGSATTIGDQLQVATKLAKAELPQFATQVAGPANLASKMGISSGQVLAFMAAESAGGIRNTDLADPFNSLLNASLKPNRVAQRAAKGLGLDYNAGFWGKYGLAGGEQRIESAMDSRGLKRGDRITALTSLFGETGVQAYLAAKNGDLAGATNQVVNSKGAVQSAYNVSQLSSGAQLLDAETKLKTSVDQLTTKALPLLVTALNDVSGGLDAITHWGDKTRTNPAGGTPLDTLAQLFQGNNPLTGQAQDAAARRGAGNGDSIPFIGGVFESAGLIKNVVSRVASLAPHSLSAAALSQTGGAAAGLGILREGAGGGAFGGGGEGAGKGTAAAGYGGPMGADWIRNNIAVGSAASGNKDADMKRFENNLKIAIAQGQDPRTIASALGLAVQAINQNSMLSGSDKTLAIISQQKEAASYLGAQAKAAAASPFHANNAGIGGFEAGYGSTSVRFGGGKDPQAALIAKLEQQLAAANRQLALLQQIVTNTGRVGPTAHASPLAGMGTNRMAVR